MALIGISGRLGSGKDTAGSIIQYLTAKDRGSECMKRIRAGLSIDGHHNSDFVIKKFAGKLKLIGSILAGVSVEDFEDQDFKKLPMGLGWEMTYREFLQKLGTEAMRDGLHKEVWVNALFADYKATPNKTVEESFQEQFLTGVSEIYYRLPNWIITDMRFPNEIAAVELRGGITIRVNRVSDIKVQHSGKEDDFTIEKFDKNNPKHVDLKAGQDKTLHPSETALDDAKFDYVIENDGTLDELVEKVRAILIREKIIS
jgi:hypothetical protein